MLFNESETLSFSDVSAATGIPPAELKRNLQSLACVKVSASSLKGTSISQVQICT
jgi:DNA-binding IclR family transcriptional regulator